jgi:hypothetical protein
MRSAQSHAVRQGGGGVAWRNKIWDGVNAVCYLAQQLGLILVVKRQPRGGHDEEGGAEGPNVNGAAVVAAPRKHLRRGVTGGAAVCAHRLVRDDVVRKAKVEEPRRAVGCEEDVFGFDVAVGDALAVAVVNRREDLRA